MKRTPILLLHAVFGTLILSTAAVFSQESITDPSETSPTQESEPESEATSNHPDQAAIAEEAAQLRQIMQYPEEQLNDLAYDTAYQALADLGPGRKLARYETREKIIQRTRLQWLEKVQQAETERDELRQQLDTEIVQIQEQFSDNPTQCNRQLLYVVQRYRPRLLQLKTEIAQCTEEVNATDGQLELVRRNKLTLERDHRLVQRGLIAKPQQATQLVVSQETLREFQLDNNALNLDSVMEELGGDVGEFFDETPSSAEAVDQETVQEALDELKTLFESE